MKAKTLLMICLVLLAAFAAAARAEEPLTTRVNIVLNDGTIMFYAGEDAGISVGDEFEVTRGGNVVGHIKAIRTKKLFTYAELQDGDVQEMDTVTRTKKTAAAKTSSAPKKEETPKAEDKKDDDGGRSSSRSGRSGSSASRSSESKDDSDSKARTTSTRREEAKQETPKTRSTERDAGSQPPPKRPEPQKAPVPAAAAKEDTKHPQQLPPIGMMRPTAFGLTGLMFTPTADTMPKSRGDAHFYYADADEDYLLYKDVGLGFSYGLADNIEIAYTYVNTDLESPASLGSISGDSNTNIFSIKYQFNKSNALFSDSTSESRYAAGFQYFDRDDSFSATISGTAVSGEYSANATRFYVTSSHKYSSGVAHVGMYYQGGDIVDDSDYDGFGITAGLEYPFGESATGGEDMMTLLVEYDSKAFYLGTYRTPSIGLRYNFREMGHLTLGMVDVTDASVLLIEGAYDF